MRVFLVKMAGLWLFIYNLEPGTMTIAHDRPDRNTRTYTLDHDDFREGADDYDDQMHGNQDKGIHVSAVGLRMCLTKNEGILNVQYRGESGGSVDWTIRAMEMERGGYVNASASTQTYEAMAVNEHGRDISQPRMTSSSIQAVSIDTVAPQKTKRRCASASTMTHTNEPDPSWSVAMAPHVKENPKRTLFEPKAGLKRRAGDVAEGVTSLHKRAKSMHDTPPWPRHL